MDIFIRHNCGERENTHGHRWVNITKRHIQAIYELFVKTYIHEFCFVHQDKKKKQFMPSKFLFWADIFHQTYTQFIIKFKGPNLCVPIRSNDHVFFC
jgi:hypothetical protein